MSETIGPSEAARRLGVSIRTVQRWLRNGRLPAVQVGERVKVDASAFDVAWPGGTGLSPTGAAPSTGPSSASRRRGGVAPNVRPIRRLLVANRGELVVRIARTCRRLGIACLALVVSDQRDAWWTAQLDERIPFEGTYLDGAAIVAAALQAGTDAIHPGYGFLAERPDFADAVQAAGLIWVGPPAEAMRALGDKAAARRVAIEEGVPVLEGYQGRGQSDALLAREAARIGFPVLIKPSAGGGGKGMHLVERPAELRAVAATARREALAAFGDDRLILERYLANPRHVEVQLLADRYGQAVHLGERDCSLQRRHQKVIEEAPAPGVGSSLRARLGESALRLARAAGYQGAGTAEFLLAPDGTFAFLEVNARLQVEHPVTEAITGLDLVELQLRVAAGEPLPLTQADVELRGHAFEARLYAEAPWAGFLPVEGRVLGVSWPTGPGVRVDAGVGTGDEIGLRYDPLLAKIIAHGEDREEARSRLADALASTSLVGCDTNRGLLSWLADLPETRDGTMSTETIASNWPIETDALADEVWRAGAAALAEVVGPQAETGFRLNAEPALRISLDGQAPRSVPITSRAAAAYHWRPADGGDGPTVSLDVDGRAVTARLGAAPQVERASRAFGQADHPGEPIRAPMPGTVLSVGVSEGEEVEAHQALLVLEAMKMENAVTAPAAGRVARILVRPGQAVRRDDPLIELA